MGRIQKGFATPEGRKKNIQYMRDEGIKGFARARKGAASMTANARGWQDAVRRGMDQAILSRDMYHTAAMRVAYRDVSIAVGAAKAAEQAVAFAEQAAIIASGAVDMAYDPPMKPKTKKESAWAEEGDKHD